MNAFTERYHKWCKKHGYNFSVNKAAEIHKAARDRIAMMPMNEGTEFLIQQAVEQLQATQKALAAMREHTQSLAISLQEYLVVMQMYGVKNLGPQLMAEIGDVRRFHNSIKALVAYADSSIRHTWRATGFLSDFQTKYHYLLACHLMSVLQTGSNTFPTSSSFPPLANPTN